MMKVATRFSVGWIVTTAASLASAQLPGVFQDVVDTVQNGDLPGAVSTVSGGVDTATGLVDTATGVPGDVAGGDVNGLLDMFQGVGEALNSYGGTNGTALGDALQEANNMLENIMGGAGQGGGNASFGSLEELVNYFLPDNVTLPPGFEFNDTVPFDPATFTLPPGSSQTLPPGFSFPENMQDLVNMVTMAAGDMGGNMFCNLCDGEGFDPTQSFSGINCGDWTLIAGLAFPAGSEQCYIMRAVAAQFCGCQTGVINTCDLCMNGATTDIKVQQPLWFIPNATCGDILNLPAVDGLATCNNIQSTSYLCGCAGAVPECSICGDGISLGNPQEILDMVMSGIGGSEQDFSCGDLQGLLSLPSTLDFVNLFSDLIMDDNKNFTCQDVLAQAESSAGFQLPGYCGCSNAPAPPKMCDMCPNTDYEPPQRTDNPIRRCGFMAFKAQFVNNMTVCGELQNEAESLKCCESPMQQPSENPPTEGNGSTEPTQTSGSEATQGSVPTESTQATVQAAAGSSGVSTASDGASANAQNGSAFSASKAVVTSSGHPPLGLAIEIVWSTVISVALCLVML